ncbi:MAG: PCRF domain-containing protein, partial [Oscillospiraceae bacterium]
MLDKLQAVRNRFEEISNSLQDPSVISNNDLYRNLMKDYKNLTPIAETYDKYISAKASFDEAKELLDEGGLEPEMKELAQMEYDENKTKMQSLSDELKILLLPRDENDSRSVIVEIRGGAGGEEAALFAHSLFRMYTMYAQSKGWSFDVINANETEIGGMKEVSFSIEGDGAYSRFKFESGVHRVQRVPETETQGRVHTSTVTVAVMPEAEEVELDINPAELKIDTFRSSGAGGQHINKTSSAIRVTHLPTGMVVE